MPHFKVEAQTFQFNTARILTLAIFSARSADGYLAHHSPRSSASPNHLIHSSRSAHSCSSPHADWFRWRDVDRTTNWGVLLTLWRRHHLEQSARSDRREQVSSLSNPSAHRRLAHATVYRHHRHLRHFPHRAIQQHRQHRAPRADLRRSRDRYGHSRHRAHSALNFSRLMRIYAARRHTPNAIVFGSGHIQQRDMVRIGLVLNLTFAVLLLASQGGLCLVESSLICSERRRPFRPRLHQPIETASLRRLALIKHAGSTLNARRIQAYSLYSQLGQFAHI